MAARRVRVDPERLPVVLRGFPDLACAVQGNTEIEMGQAVLLRHAQGMLEQRDAASPVGDLVPRHHGQARKNDPGEGREDFSPWG